MTPTPTSRSQGTRDRILEAARAMFAAHGYEGATLRNIAAQASTNVALVIRYFGSKEDLFAMAAHFDLQLPPLGELDRSRLGQVMVSHFLAIWEESRSSRELVALLRAAASYPTAKARMQQIFHDQLLDAIASLGFRPEESAMRAALVASQMLGFALIRYVLEFDTRCLDRDTVVLVLGRTIQHYLTLPLDSQ
jgi:AcrR family transcriptional regulator